jgi:hypothetical protein
MKTTFKLSGLCFCGLVAAASIAAAQVSVSAPPPGTAGPTNVQAGPVNVQTTPGGGTSVTLPPGAAAPIRDNAAVREENRVERRADRRADAADWRMVRHNNQWWYWHPNNNWSVYQNNAWGPYNAAAAPQPGAQTNYYARGLGSRRWSSGYRGVAPATAPPAVPNQPMPTNTSPMPTNASPMQNTAPPMQNTAPPLANPPAGAVGNPAGPAPGPSPAVNGQPIPAK